MVLSYQVLNCFQEELSTNMEANRDRASGWQLLPSGQQDLYTGGGWGGGGVTERER